MFDVIKSLRLIESGSVRDKFSCTFCSQSNEVLISILIKSYTFVTDWKHKLVLQLHLFARSTLIAGIFYNTSETRLVI